MDKQQGPTYSTGNYIQYPVINCNGKEIYIYITQSLRYTVEHNVIQHCKSTIILQ